MPLSASINTGFTKPNRLMLAAILLICFFECVRAFRARGLSAAIGNSSIRRSKRRVPSVGLPFISAFSAEEPHRRKGGARLRGRSLDLSGAFPSGRHAHLGLAGLAAPQRELPLSRGGDRSRAIPMLTRNELQPANAKR